MKTQIFKLKAVQPLTLVLVAAGVLTLVSLWLFARTPAVADAPAPSAATSKAALTVALAQARTTRVPIMLTANGNVAAWQEASVGAETAGLRVLELKAQVGDVVQRGQVLATFADDSVQADVALARAGVAEAAANAAEATANADRARALQGSGALSAQQVSQALAAELAARARVDSAKAQLNAQLLRLKHTRLLAPDSGTITARSATLGAVMGAGAELFRLIRQGRLEWRAEVTSTELARISVGTPVVVTGPGGAQMQGRVRMVAPSVDTATRNGLVYVDLMAHAPGTKTAAADFKPGMFARGAFELGSSHALTVPQTAVVVRDGFSYVYRVDAGNRVTQLKVETGRVLGDEVEIVTGIKPEDRLVTSGGSFLSDGDTVRVVDASRPKSTAAALQPARAAGQ